MMVEELDRAATAASDLLKALASPNRLKILCHLIDGEKSVGQVAGMIGIRETTASQHLALLRKDRLVASRRAGQTIFYRIDSPVAARLIGVLYEHFCAGLAGDGPPASDVEAGLDAGLEVGPDLDEGEGRA